MKLCASFLLLLCFYSVFSQTVQIEDYRPEFSNIRTYNHEWLGLRTFKQNGMVKYLAVDPYSFKTAIISTNEISSLNKLDYAKVNAEFVKSCFIKAQQLARTNESSIQNAGIDRHFNREKGVNLTLDLCPSHRQLDRIVFDSTYNYFQGKEENIPIGISVSGKWMQQHPEDLEWLKYLSKSGKWNIIWINHSYNHFMNNEPLTENFLLSKGTDLNTEILQNEQLMIEKGITPSVFFRFPGLVSDKAILEKVLHYGLIPIGADAWLAKGQRPVNGSIVLIHGNGNEESGVKDWINLLKYNIRNIQLGHWILYDLNQSLQCNTR